MYTLSDSDLKKNLLVSIDNWNDLKRKIKFIQRIGKRKQKYVLKLGREQRW